MVGRKPPGRGYPRAPVNKRTLTHARARVCVSQRRGAPGNCRSLIQLSLDAILPTCVCPPMLLRILVALTLLACVPSIADAVVMCSAKRPDGSVREGAAVKLRSACKANELQLDPVGLGLAGPAGPQGPTGPEGPAGVPGPGLVAVDSNDVPLGAVVSGVDGLAAYGQLVSVATTTVDGLAHLVWVRVEPIGFAWGGTDPDSSTPSALLFTSSDCSGTAYVVAPNRERTMGFRGVVAGPHNQLPPWGDSNVFGPGTVVYFPSGTSLQINGLSYAETAAPSGCAAGVPIGGSLCCSVGTHSNTRVAPAGQQDLGDFVVPFRFVTQ